MDLWKGSSKIGRASLVTWVWSPESTWGKKRTNSKMLSSELYIHSMTCAMHNNNKQFSKNQNLLKVPKERNQVDKREKGWRISGGAWEHDVKLMKRNWLTKLCTLQSQLGSVHSTLTLFLATETSVAVWLDSSSEARSYRSVRRLAPQLGLGQFSSSPQLKRRPRRGRP